MKSEETLRLVAKLKANWNLQPIDEVIVAEWHERLAHVEYRHAVAALVEFAESGREYPPTPGQVRALAIEIATRESEEKRRKVRKLEVVPSLDERRRGAAKLRELVESIGGGKLEKVEPVAVQAEPAPRITIAPCADTLRAQEIILAKRRELGIGEAV
jgi:hypothetical protein